MPIYNKGTDFPGNYTDHGVLMTGDNFETQTFLTEAKLTFADVTGYLVGEQITEATSGFTGYISGIDTDNNILKIVLKSGEFTGGENITGGTSLTVAIPTAVENLVTRAADAPIYTPLLHSHDVSSTGSGDDQTIYLDEKTRWLVIWRVAGGNITACNYQAAYPLMPVPVGGYQSFKVDFRIPKLVLQFDAAGTCQVLESAEELP